MSIWGVKFKYFGQNNTKIEFKGYQISIAMDDSCGAFKNYKRTDIRVYDKNDKDVTEEFTSISGDTYLRTSEDLFNIMNLIHLRTSKGY